MRKTKDTFGRIVIHKFLRMWRIDIDFFICLALKNMPWEQRNILNVSPQNYNYFVY